MAINPEQTEGMTCGQLIAALMAVSPNAAFLARRVDGKWLPVYGIKATGSHRNAYTLETLLPGETGGDDVVEPSI